MPYRRNSWLPIGKKRVLLLVVVVTLIYYISRVVIPGRGAPSGQTGDQEQQEQQQKQQQKQEQKQEVERRQIGVPLGLNLTRPAESFWQGYREVLLLDGADVTVSTPQSEPQSQTQSQTQSRKKQDNINKGQGGNDWFNDVNAETMLIAEMWSKVEKPVVAKDDYVRRVDWTVEDHSQDDGFLGNKVLQVKAYERIQLDIAVRAATLRNASREFDRILGHRTRVIQEFMQRGMVWQRRSGLLSGGNQQTVGDTGLTEKQLQQMAKDATGGGAPGQLRTPDGAASNGGSVITDGVNGTTPLGLENLATYDNATARSLAGTVSRLIDNLVHQHAKLLERFEGDGDENRSGNGNGMNGLHYICEVTLPWARRAEGRFVEGLVKASLSASEHGAAARWRDEKRGGAIRVLEERICALDARRAEMRKGLEWLEARFKIPKKTTPHGVQVRGSQEDDPEMEDDDEWYLRMSKTKVRHGHGAKEELVHVPELFVWVQSAMELLNAWSTVLMDVEEGVLMALRRKEIAEEKKLIAEKTQDNGGIGATTDQQAADGKGGDGTTSSGFDYEASWQRWKQRNCGGTSCYDVATPAARLRHLFGGTENNKKPLAGEAWDERDRFPDWEVGVWKGIYEKACCQEAALANILKHGETTPDYPVDMGRTRA